MKRAGRFGRLEILVLLTLSMFAAASWAQTSIDDLSDAKTAFNGNLFLGQGAGSVLTTGDFNTATGILALQDISTGSGNTANGRNALLRNTTGNSNTAIGFGAHTANTTGSNNTASGREALHFNTASSNTANGFKALYRTSSGQRNVALGSYAGGKNRSGSGNVFLGRTAGNNKNYRTLSNRLVIANTNGEVYCFGAK